jgi:hypothetical protein
MEVRRPPLAVTAGLLAQYEDCGYPPLALAERAEPGREAAAAGGLLVGRRLRVVPQGVPRGVAFGARVAGGQAVGDEAVALLREQRQGVQGRFLAAQPSAGASREGGGGDEEIGGVLAAPGGTEAPIPDRGGRLGAGILPLVRALQAAEAGAALRVAARQDRERGALVFGAVQVGGPGRRSRNRPPWGKGRPRAGAVGRGTPTAPATHAAGIGKTSGGPSLRPRRSKISPCWPPAPRAGGRDSKFSPSTKISVVSSRDNTTVLVLI